VPLRPLTKRINQPPRTVVSARRHGGRMSTGIVRSFDRNKGCGSIQPDDGSRDGFVDAAAVAQSGMLALQIGQKVSYLLRHDPLTRKFAAISLRAVSGADVGRAPVPADPFRPARRPIMAKGTIKWFHAIMSYGVIAPDDGTAGVLVRMPAGGPGRLGGLKKGDRLEYDTVRGANGRSLAVNLRPVAEVAGQAPAAKRG
jgi:CspA family cold shock protein